MSDEYMIYFAYAHLPEHLQRVSKPFGELAGLLNSQLPPGKQKELTMQKLLEAKDCAVRATLNEGN